MHAEPNKQRRHTLTEVLESAPGFTTPEFTTGLRGYDRIQVDQYIDRLHALVSDAEERARAAEEDLEYSQHNAVGSRVTEIFELAVEESRDLRVKVAAESEGALAEARAEAEQIVKAAHRYAEDVQEQIELDREQALGEIVRLRDEGRSQLEEMAARRAAVVADLRRLHDALEAAVGLVDPTEPGPRQRKSSAAKSAD